MLTRSQAALYRRLTIGDKALLAAMFAGESGFDALDGRTSSLVRLAALIAGDAESPALLQAVGDAVGAGASSDQITGVLVDIARIAGSSRVMSAAPRLAMALGYDVDAGLEDADLLDDGI